MPKATPRKMKFSTRNPSVNILHGKLNLLCSEQNYEDLNDTFLTALDHCKVA